MHKLGLKQEAAKMWHPLLYENLVFTKREVKELPGAPNWLLIRSQTFHPHSSTTPYFKSQLRLFLFFLKIAHDLVGPTVHRDCVATKNR